jgi:MFS family permease
MSFGIAFVARPIGAIAFGHFGDRVGRKSTLVASLMLMGGATLAIAFLPTYAAIGWLAPALLCLMRFGQGFGLSGEWSGAALLVVENAPKGWEARFVAIMQLGSPVGFFVATGVFLALGETLGDEAFREWGWRLPFLASALLVGIGLWVRLRITETPAFRAALAHHKAPTPVPIGQVLAHHGGAVVAGGAGVLATFSSFYLVTTYALAEATGPQGLDRNHFLLAEMAAALFYAAGILVSGWIADRSSPGRVLGLAALGVAACGLIFGPGVSSGSLELASAAICATMFAIGMANSPLGAWLTPLFPVRLRYTGVALAFNVGGVIGGALTPVAAQALSVAGHAQWVGLLMCVAGVATWAATKCVKAADPLG